MKKENRQHTNVTYFCTCCNSIISPYQRTFLENADGRKDLIKIDQDIVKVIQVLNRKGWTTVASSAGKYSHISNEIRLPYVEFSSEIQFSEEKLARLPDDWKINDIRENVRRVSNELLRHKELRYSDLFDFVNMIRDASRYRFTLDIARVNDIKDFEARVVSGIFALEDWASDVLDYRKRETSVEGGEIE